MLHHQLFSILSLLWFDECSCIKYCYQLEVDILLEMLNTLELQIHLLLASAINFCSRSKIILKIKLNFVSKRLLYFDLDFIY